MEDPRFRRVMICAPDADPRLLTSALSLAALVPAADLHVVATTAPSVLERFSATVREVFGRLAGRVRLQLVPEPTLDAFYRLARDEGADLLVLSSALAAQRARQAPCSTMVLPSSIFADNGKGVVALVTWEDGAATLDIALDLARRMRQPRLTACHVYFNEAAIVSDEWERREAERRQRALDLLLARARCADVPVATCVIQCPDVQRALTRPEVPTELDMLVTSVQVRFDAPVLTIRLGEAPDAVRSRHPWYVVQAGAESG